MSPRSQSSPAENPVHVVSTEPATAIIESQLVDTHVAEPPIKLLSDAAFEPADQRILALPALLILTDLGLWFATNVVTLSGVLLLNRAEPELLGATSGLMGLTLISFFLLSAMLDCYTPEKNRHIAGKFMVVGLLISALCGTTSLMSPPLPALTVPAALGGMLLFLVCAALAHDTLCQSRIESEAGSVFHRLENGIKRVADSLCALMGLVMLSPLLAFTAIAIRLESRGCVLYRQTRIGLGESPFRIYKFRSMWVGDRRTKTRLPRQTSQQLFKALNDPRVTRIGRLIRKLSIDELPQLFNVLKGDMSLVGPRPPMPEEFRQMNARHRQKFRALPGLTGLWQVAGRIRNERSFDAVAHDDLTYIEQWSLMSDLKILLRTIPVVVLQKGAS